MAVRETEENGRLPLLPRAAAAWGRPLHELAEQGFHVAILSSSGKGEALARELAGIGITGSNQSIDDLRRLVDETMSRWGRIDALVNSAGHGPRAPLLDLSDADWHRGMEVYFLNVVRPTRLVTPIMVKQKSGVIVNVSTAWASSRVPCSRRLLSFERVLQSMRRFSRISTPQTTFE